MRHIPKHPIRLELPDPESTAGVYLICPIASWYAKGHWWWTNVKWELKPVRYRERLRMFYNWVGPEVSNHGTWKYPQTGPCRCKECAKGRRLVKKGWRPEIDQMGVPV